MANEKQVLDVVIIGAGISGIGIAYWLQKKCPAKTFAILEARATIGGTWSLFRYPGIRSDSDMFTFGYRFKPWQNPKSLSQGHEILDYLQETIRENDLEKRIQFGSKLLEAHWSDDTKTWNLKVQRGDDIIETACRVLSVCSGYYSYSEAHRPDFEGEASFKGDILVPQFWPENYDFSNKKVIVIGSGATAVTLVPAMAEQGAAHVTMVQRSPTYIFSIANQNRFFNFLRKCLPANWSYRLIRYMNLRMGVFLFGMTQRFPNAVKANLVAKVARQLPKGYDVGKHFTPSYNPWDQRLCVVPDGDLFKAIRSGKASVSTGEISRFTEDGILMKSGEAIPADLIVLATGLNISVMGGARFFVNGKALDLSTHQVYKGMMLSHVPNMVYAFGYSNASWTLKVDLTANYLCNLLNHMDQKGYAVALPIPDQAPTDDPFLPLRSGYVFRAASIMPKQGRQFPWLVYQNYFKDRRMIRNGKIDDGVLKFRT